MSVLSQSAFSAKIYLHASPHNDLRLLKPWGVSNLRMSSRKASSSAAKGAKSKSSSGSPRKKQQAQTAVGRKNISLDDLLKADTSRD